MAKAGSTNLVDVVRYADAVTKSGFVFMDTPASIRWRPRGRWRGANVGCKPAPSIKIATNTTLFQRMDEDMDINCGAILDGEETVQESGERIFERILRVASGERTKSEQYDFGSAEFAPWPLGVTV